MQPSSTIVIGRTLELADVHRVARHHAPVLLAPAASAKDNEGGGGGACQSCKDNVLTGDSWCVSYGTSGSNLFGSTGCKTTKTYSGLRVRLTCVLSGNTCMGSTPLPGSPGYL